MAKRNQFRGKSLADLEALKTAIKPRLNEFKAIGNVEQTITYQRILAQIEAEISANRAK